MTNLKINKSMKNRFRSLKFKVKEYKIAKREFERLLEEAEEDIRNGRVYTYKEVMLGGLEILERRIPELSEEEQIEARKFVEEEKNRILQGEI